MRYSILLGILSIFVAAGCSSRREAPDGGAPAARVEASPRQAKAQHHIPTSDPVERRRRSEAVRRAAEELAARGVPTQNYLLNLIADEDVYTVAFVSKQGRSLRAEITVRVRREDFEILDVEGPGLEGVQGRGSAGE